jgi:hypothetical protein
VVVVVALVEALLADEDEDEASPPMPSPPAPPAPEDALEVLTPDDAALLAVDAGPLDSPAAQARSRRARTTGAIDSWMRTLGCYHGPGIASAPETTCHRTDTEETWSWRRGRSG